MCFEIRAIETQAAGKQNRLSHLLGFSLIELLVVLALVGTLATVAWPSYRDVIARSLEREGMLYLLRLQSVQERFRQSTRRYQGLDVIESHLPFPDRLARVYRLEVDTSDLGDYFKLVLLPVTAGEGRAAISLDSRGFRSPREVWP